MSDTGREEEETVIFAVFDGTKTVDASLVGTPDMLTSPNVSEAPPHVNRPVPVPSVYKDERGEIHNLALGQDVPKRINILYTRRGVMRSGDIHANTQHDFIFSGKVELWMLTSDTDEDGNAVTKITTHGPGDYIQIPPYVPHVFHFKTDTVMAEWWEPGSFKAWFYQPFRHRVDQSFKRTRPGKMEPLVPKQSCKNRVVLAGFAGAVLGLGAGLLLSAARLRK